MLGVGFFFFGQITTSLFWRNFLISFKNCSCPESKFEKIFYLWSFFVKLWGFKDCHFRQFWKINAQYLSCFKRVSGDLIRLRNRSKLAQGSLYAIIDLIIGAKSITSIWLRFCQWFLLNMACGGMFLEKISLKKIDFYFIAFIFLMLLLLHKP